MNTIAGNKYNNILVLKNNGFPIPDFKLIDFFDFSIFLNEFIDNNKNYNNKIFDWDTKKLNSFRNEIKNSLNNSIDNVKLQNCLSNLKTEYYAVRSSFYSEKVKEDSENESFAGIGDSFLFVNASNLKKAVIKCFLSIFSNKALEYFKIQNYNPFDFSVSVFIQNQILCKKSFIIFSKESFNNQESILISSSYGTAESLVSGKSFSDNFHISRTNFKLLNKNISKKKRHYDFEPTEKKIVLLITPPSLWDKPCLNEQEIIPLCRLGLKSENIFNCPQDIEGGIDKNGKIWIFQSRPSVDIIDDDNEPIILDSSNITESYPGVTTPLTFSFAKKAYSEIFKKTASKIGISSKKINLFNFEFDNLISFKHNKIYYIVSNWYSLFNLIPFSVSYKKVWNQMVGIKNSNVEKKQIKNSVLELIRVFFSIMFQLEQHSLKCQIFHLKTSDILKKYNDKLKNKQSVQKLLKIYHDSAKDFYNQFSTAIINDLFLMIFTKLLLIRLKLKYGKSYLNIYSKILDSVNDTYSFDYIESLNITGKKIIEKYDKTIFNNPDIILKDPEFKKDIQKIINKFGVRHSGELKLEIPSLKENPAQIFDILKSISKKEIEPNLKHIKISKSSILLNFLVNKTSFLIKERENMRFVRAKVYNMGRKIFLEIAKHFKDINLINDTNDIFYLYLDEISDIITGGRIFSNSEIKILIELRKKEYENNSGKNHFRRYVIKSLIPIPEVSDAVNNFKGTIAVSGQISGKVFIKESKIKRPDNYILVAKELEPGDIKFILGAKGIITEYGSIISHTAIIARQFNIPFITNVSNITKKVKNNQLIKIESDGAIKILST